MTPSRVLIVEDDGDRAGALGVELAHAGYEVRSVGDGPAALRVEAEWAPRWCCSPDPHPRETAGESENAAVAARRSGRGR